MDRLGALEIYIRVVDTGSFSAAALTRPPFPYRRSTRPGAWRAARRVSLLRFSRNVLRANSHLRCFPLNRIDAG